MFCSISKVSILAAAMVVATQAAAPLGKPIATITSTGAVQVGAASLEATGVRSWPVLEGDQISTDAAGSALISSPSIDRVELRDNSKVTVTEDHVSLQKGAVGSDNLPVRLRDYTVSPADDGARNWFVVADEKGQVLVAAHRGDIRISQAGAAPLLLPAGSYAMPAPSPKPSPKSDKKDDGDDRKRGGAATAGQHRRMDDRLSLSCGEHRPRRWYWRRRCGRRRRGTHRRWPSAAVSCSVRNALFQGIRSDQCGPAILPDHIVVVQRFCTTTFPVHPQLLHGQAFLSDRPRGPACRLLGRRAGLRHQDLAQWPR